MGSAMSQLEPKDNPTILLQQVHRWRMAFFGTVILLAGAVIGASLSLLVLGPKPPERPQIPDRFFTKNFEEFVRTVDLTGEQRSLINHIMDEHMEELRRIREEEMFPKIVAELETMKKEIDDVLTEEQKNLLQQHMQRMEREFWRGPGGGRGGPGNRGGGLGGGRGIGPGGGRGMGPDNGRGGIPDTGPRGPEDRDRQRLRGGQSDTGPRRTPGNMDRRGFGLGQRRGGRQGPNSLPEPNMPDSP